MIYGDDFRMSVHKVACRALARYERAHPEFEALGFSDLLEVRRKLLRNAIEPKIAIKMAARLRSRGHEIVDGKGSERLTISRLRNRFIMGLVATIEDADRRTFKGGYGRLQELTRAAARASLTSGTDSV